jgi:hypothetical protein
MLVVREAAAVADLMVVREAAAVADLMVVREAASRSLARLTWTSCVRIAIGGRGLSDRRLESLDGQR